jgi:hypothetical protein
MHLLATNELPKLISNKSTKNPSFYLKNREFARTQRNLG